MIIGLLTLEIYIPYSHSLKEKRKILKSFKDRMRNKFNVAIAELNFQNKWQRTKIGLVTVNQDKKLIDRIFSKIVEDAEKSIEGEIIESKLTYF
jgi:uncharacterized protein YlxP (DUF503 family)